MTVLDAEALATLTPEEQAAIQDSEYSPEELDAMKKLAHEGDDDSDDDSDDEDDGDDADPAPVEAAPATPAQAPATAEDAPAPAATPAPRYDAKLPEDFEAQVQALKDEEAALKTRYREGELDFDAFEQARDALLSKRESLHMARVKAEISVEMHSQSLENQWTAAVDRFMEASARAGMDYRNDEAKAADLDLFVRTLAGKPENNGRANEWFLAEADRRVRALHGVAMAPAGNAPAKASRKPDLSDAPKTLAQVPGGDGPGDVSGEFADLDGLEGFDLETAIARMSPTQRERYARA